MKDEFSNSKVYLLASDFDQTLSFNDSGRVLSEIMGISRFDEKVTGLAKTQGQCLATCKSLVNREKNLFAGHFRGNFLRSRAWRKLCDCPTAKNKQY